VPFLCGLKVIQKELDLKEEEFCLSLWAKKYKGAYKNEYWSGDCIIQAFCPIIQVFLRIF
jgi:hypothetical protein